MHAKHNEPNTETFQRDLIVCFKMSYTTPIVIYHARVGGVLMLVQYDHMADAVSKLLNRQGSGVIDSCEV